MRTYLANLESLPLAHRHGPCAEVPESSTHEQGHVHRPACGHPHQRRGRLHRDHSGLGLSEVVRWKSETRPRQSGPTPKNVLTIKTQTLNSADETPRETDQLKFHLPDTKTKKCNRKVHMKPNPCPAYLPPYAPTSSKTVPTSAAAPPTPHARNNPPENNS